MHPRIHVDHALDRLTADEAELRRARTARQVADELALVEGSTSRGALRGAARRTRQGAVAVGAAGVLLAPQATGVAAATEAQPTPPVAGQPDAAPDVVSGAVGGAVVAAADAAGEVVEDVVDVAQQAVDASEEAPADAADSASPPSEEAPADEPTGDTQDAEPAPEEVEEEAGGAADAVAPTEDVQDAVAVAEDTVEQPPDTAAPPAPADVVGAPADALPEDALPEDALPEDTDSEGALGGAPAGSALPDHAADAADGAVEDVAAVAEEVAEEVADVVHALPPVVEDVAPGPVTPPAAPQAPSRPNRPATPPRPQPQPQPLPAPHVPGPPVSLPEVTVPDVSPPAVPEVRPPQPVRVDPVASPQPDRPIAPVVEAVYAVDPVISPNLRLTPRPVVAPAAAPTLEARLREAQSRPVDEARVSAWTAAVAQAWTAMQQGAGTPDAVVAADDLAATPTLGWSYAVQPGDTLWTISERVWGTSELSASDLADTWQLIYTWNADELGGDPDTIPVGAVIQIPADIGSTA